MPHGNKGHVPLEGTGQGKPCAVREDLGKGAPLQKCSWEEEQEHPKLILQKWCLSSDMRVVRMDENFGISIERETRVGTWLSGSRAKSYVILLLR